MTTKTQNDLILQALGELGLKAAGQTPPAEDVDAVAGYVGPTIEMLAKRDVVTVDDIEAIPVEWFIPIAVFLAEMAANEFGMPGVPASPSRPNPVAWAETMLREIVYARPTFEPLRGNYF